MGIPVDEEEIPDHYWCEQCTPQDHRETLQALAAGEKIWEERTKIFQNEKKMSKSRKSRGREDGKPGWLKKEVEPADEVVEAEQVQAQGQEQEQEQDAPETSETGGKRKRESIRPEPELKEEPATVSKQPNPVPAPVARPEKRRKSSQMRPASYVDPETALVDIEQLPADRKKIATLLSKTIADDIEERLATGFVMPDGQTAHSIGNYYAARIEYALQMNYGSPKESGYAQQFRNLSPALKRNKVLIERLLDGSLTADELATMESKDMASEELQRERAKMKEELDRQVVAVQEEGPRIRRTHKGDEIIEDENEHATAFGTNAQPVRERTGGAEDGDGSPVKTDGQDYAYPGSPSQADQTVLSVNTQRPSVDEQNRRTSSQNFDIGNIWAKTVQSPTTGTAAPRPMQMAPRRRSSVQQQPRDQVDGAKDDPDVDRLLADDDETYSPAELAGDSTVVWRGKIVHTGEGEPVVNARFVAGRDLSDTVAWEDLIPQTLTIDGRLQVDKAEVYLCGLQHSTSSDVAVLALTPYDDKAAFDSVFQYFASRKRYAVVNTKVGPGIIKDLYLMPVEVGGSLPEHVNLLEHCTIRLPVEERLLLAVIVVARAPETAVSAADTSLAYNAAPPSNGHHIPQHVRAAPGLAGSPLNTNGPTFSPSAHMPPGNGGYAPPTPNTFPPTPYSAPESYAPQPSHQNPLVAEILGHLQFAPTAIQVVGSDPNIDRAKLLNLRAVLEQNPAAQMDIGELARLLNT